MSTTLKNFFKFQKSPTILLIVTHRENKQYLWNRDSTSDLAQNYKASNWENLPKGDLSYTLESRQTPALYSGSQRCNLRMVSQGANKRYLPFSEEYFSLPSAIYWRRLQHSHIYLILVVEKGKIGVKNCLYTGLTEKGRYSAKKVYSPGLGVLNWHWK